jgi:hypothetical protein
MVSAKFSVRVRVSGSDVGLTLGLRFNVVMVIRLG